MTDDIIELQVGYHENKNNPFQRIICDTDFTNPYYECKGENYSIYYSKDQPKHRNESVYKACNNLDVILEVAKMNYENNGIVATIRDDKIITGDDIDIWKDIKVWINGTYPKKQPTKLKYRKHSYHSRYLKSGINEIKMFTDKIYIDKGINRGHVVSFEIKSSTFQSYYHIIYDGYNRKKFEAYPDGFSGRYHGYEYFDTFEEMQDFFKEKFNVTLVKDGDTIYHHYH